MRPPLILLIFLLLFFFILYGVIQERIMTRPYGETEPELFQNSLFLVLNNRIITVIFCVIFLKWNRKSLKNQAPLIQLTFLFSTNTLSAYCQYESLKYINFPTQTLGKCAKSIPVLLWGTITGVKKYRWEEYIIHFLLALSAATFMLNGDIGTERDNEAPSFFSSDFYGIFLISAYLLLEGLTSTWQEKLLQLSLSNQSDSNILTADYGIVFNQLFYANLGGGFLSFLWLYLSGQFWNNLEFAYRHPFFYLDVVSLSCCSMFGQIIIYTTITYYGALLFSTIMTVRHIFSILISCLLYLHPLTTTQWFSLFGVFICLGMKQNISSSNQKKQLSNNNDKSENDIV